MLKLSEQVEIEITRAVYLQDGKLLKPGKVITLPRAFATELISGGKAQVNDPAKQKQVHLPEKGKDHVK